MECPGKQIIIIWLKEYMYHTSVGSRTTGSLLLAVPTSTAMAVNSVPPLKKPL